MQTHCICRVTYWHLCAGYVSEKNKSFYYNLVRKLTQIRNTLSSNSIRLQDQKKSKKNLVSE